VTRSLIRKGALEMDVRDLLDIKAICDAGSFRKAAEALGVTQPTLSNRIAYLEGRLGARLFDRDHGRSRPTELAVLIANRAEIIGRDAALLAKDIVRLASGQAGIVRIGMGPAPGRALLGPIIERVAAQLPQVALDIVFGSTRALADQLQARDLDIAICHPIEGPGANLTCDLQLEADNVMVAHPAHEIFRLESTDVGEMLRTYPMAVPFLEQRYIDMTKQFYDVDVGQLPGRVFCSDFESLVRLVMSGPRYLTAGPIFAFAPEIDAGRLRAIDTPVPFKHQVALHTNKDAFQIPAVAMVLEIIPKVFDAVPCAQPGNRVATRPVQVESSASRPPEGRDLVEAK
jgi:DNA-binding transcriptional LysR family regulator